MLIRPWHRALLIIIPYFICLVVFQLIAYVVVGVPLESELIKQKSLLQNTTIAFFSLLATFLVVFLFVKFVDKEKFQTIGFGAKNIISDVLWAVSLSFTLLAIGFFILLASKNIAIENISFSLPKVFLSFILFIFISFSEELFFRAYILRNLMVSMNKYIALITSAVFFALLHSLNPNVSFVSFISLVVAGGALGISYIFTKNLWFPVALHFAWNFFQAHFGFNVSGQSTYSIIETSFEQANLLNGGNFGFEGSVLSIVAGLLITAWGFSYYQKKGA